MIIGAAGFVGNYLIDEVKSTLMCDVVATKLEQEKIDRDDITVIDLDILDAREVNNIINQYRPAYIFHLAAQSSVGLAWRNPALTADINVGGSLNVISAIKDLDYKPRVLLVGSGEEYGHIRSVPISENTDLNPGNVYAATKACQNMIATCYCKAFSLKLIMVRAFNHIGPNQAPNFVISDFCRQVASIELGLQEPVMNVGNLSAKRDFTDVRDVVNAYVKLIQFGNPGETYNVGRGNAISISDILNMILTESNAKIEVRVDSSKLRPVDVPIIEPDITKIYSVTGWKPRISLNDSIKDVLNFWRKKLQSNVSERK